MMNILFRVPTLSGTIVGVESDCSKPKMISVDRVVKLLGFSQYFKYTGETIDKNKIT